MSPHRDLNRRTIVLAAGAAAAVTALAPAPGARAAGPSHGPRTIPLPRGFEPEGITSDGHRHLFFGSIWEGELIRVDLRTGRTVSLLAGDPRRQIRGLRYDRRTGLVWGAGNVDFDGYIWAVDARTGEVAAQVAAPGSVFLNDLDLTRDGVWVTNSFVDLGRSVALPRRRGTASGESSKSPR